MTKPVILYRGTHYTACEYKNSLIVTHNRKGGGRQLIGPCAKEWIEAIKTAIDPKEAHELCRAIVH